jgi:hypothetical protein
MDCYRLGVIVNGQRIGQFNFIEVFTFRDLIYRGMDPLNPTHGLNEMSFME